MTDPMVSKDDLVSAGRRQLLLASLLAALPLGLSARRAEGLNPAETQLTLPWANQMDAMDCRAAA